MGKQGNKARKARRYARPRSQEAVEMSYPTAEEIEAVLAGEPVLAPRDENMLQIELPSIGKAGKEEAVPVKTSTPVKKHRVSIMADHHLSFPELYAKVYIQGPMWERRQFAEILARSKCTLAPSRMEADFVIFTGGDDVDPQLYGCTPHPQTKCDPARDDEDLVAYLECVENGIPMLGICRGAQFLHVMNGGKLYQHVNNHNSAHNMWDRDYKELIERVSSVHHQMVRSNTTGGMHIIATTGSVATEKWIDNEAKGPPGLDIEAFFYRDTVCLGIQGHPEYKGYNYFAYWTMRKIKDFFFETPDLEYQGGLRRLKADLIAQRNAGMKLEVPEITLEQDL